VKREQHVGVAALPAIEGGNRMLSPMKESESSYAPLQLYFLKRLSRLLRLRGEQSGQLNEPGLLLIDRAIYSTYCDAVDLGVTEDAQTLLHHSATPSAAAQD
jgi:hypothetical protein